MNTPRIPIRLHALRPFDRSAKARWLLTEMQLPFEDRWLDIEKNEIESPAFLKLNPQGRVPVLEFGDTPIFESGAICAFLADHYLDKGFAPALTSPLRADYQKWMYFASATLDTAQTRIMVIEDIPAGRVKTEKEAALVSDLTANLKAVSQALEKSDFLVGNRLSAADICVSYHLYWLRLWPELKVVVDQYPRVSAYVDRMAKMQSAEKVKVFSYEG